MSANYERRMRAGPKTREEIISREERICMKTHKTAKPGYSIDIKEEDQKRSKRSRSFIKESGSFLYSGFAKRIDR